MGRPVDRDSHAIMALLLNSGRKLTWLRLVRGLT
jgi:hypothetical protein